jgi:chloramphenicol-sensitive protein RarD
VPEPDNSTERSGLLYGLAAYVLWGVVPIYFKAVGQVPPGELLAHRIAWSALLLVLVLALLGRFRELLACFGDRKVLRLLVPSTVFIATNWYVYIYSVLSGQILQGSLGYFILPLVNVAIGTLFFRERMRPAQWGAISLATAGVLVLVFWLRLFPWIALTLAFSFALYGVLRKQAHVDGTVGLTIETLLLAPVALAFLAVWGAEGRLEFTRGGIDTDVLIVLSGVVTTIPLVCFAQAVRRLRIVTIGFLQYISPSLAFLIAVLAYDEKFPPAYQVGYGLIWCGVAVFVGDAVRKNRRDARRATAEEEQFILD